MRREERYKHIIDWFEEHVPVAETELSYDDPFQLLVAVILSAQCTDKRVNMTTPALFQRFPDAQTMAQAAAEDIYPYIKSISYPNNKAKHLAAMARMLCERVRRYCSGRRGNAATAARRRAQDRKRGSRRVFSSRSNACGYARFPRSRTAGAYRWSAHPASNGIATYALYSGSLATHSASLADPARPLRLYRTQAPVPGVRPAALVQERTAPDETSRQT